MSKLIPVGVERVDQSDLSMLGIAVKQMTRGPKNTYQVDEDDGTIWKLGCDVALYDDGRIAVWTSPYLTHEWELQVCYGLAERVFNKGVALAKVENWERRRRTKSRSRPYYWNTYYVRAHPDYDPSAKSIAEMCFHTDSDRAIHLRSIQQIDAV